MLIPHIETPMDVSELHAPSIGQLIAERIKYRVPELSIVKIEEPQRSLMSLISQMTCVNPEERLSAAKVLDFLEVRIQLTDCFNVLEVRSLHTRILFF